MNKLMIGGWTYHPETLVVSYGLDEYEVDLEQCTTSAQMLDWIFQFANKSWATNEAIGDLVKILNELLNPQATLCSTGMKGKPLPKGAALHKLITKSLKARETFNEWERSRTEKYGTADFIVTPEDWQDLLRMEREAK